MLKRFQNQAEAFETVCSEFRVRPFPIVIEKLIGVWNKNKILAKPYDDTMEGLEALRAQGHKLVFMANMDSFTFDFLREKFELDKVFDVLAPSCESGLLKTNPKALDAICASMGVKKSDCIFVGDSIQSDMLAAQVNQIPGVLLDRKGSQEYETKAQTMAELQPYLSDEA